MNIKDSYIHNGTAVLKDIKVESSVLKKILAGKDANDAYLDWETVCDLTGIKPIAAGTADKVGHKLTFSGGVTGDWDGSDAKTVAIPTKASWDYDDVYLKLVGGELSGDLTLKVTSGDSPKLIFQRGTLTDSYDDWRIFDTVGNLKFQHTTGSTIDWKDYVIFSATAGTITINGNTAYHAGNLSIATLMGNTAIGDSDEPVYWSGSAFVKAGAYPTKASWNYDDVYLKDLGLDTGNSTNKNTSTSLTNGNVYLKLFKTINGAESEDSKVKIYGATNVSVTTDSSGDIKITGVDSVGNADSLGGVAASQYFKNKDLAVSSDWIGRYLYTLWDNQLYAADKRLSVTVSGITSSVASLFNGNFEDGINLTAATTTINIRSTTQNAVWTDGLPYGSFYVVLYNSTAENITARVYSQYSGQGIGWHDLTSTKLNTHVWRLDNGYYQLSDLEITITKRSQDSSITLCQIMHYCTRPAGPYYMAAMSKYCDQVTKYKITASKFIGPLQGNADTATSSGSATYASNVGAAGTAGTNYVTAANVISMYSWYNTITATDAASNTAIDKWNEIVSFLAGITDTSTLSGILAGYSATDHKHAASDITSGTLGVARGGTGLGTIGIYSILYASAADTLSALAPNTTSTKKFLRMTGNGSAGAAPAWDTVTKSDVGLGSVENTALSTWAGTANITTVGTIGTGKWQGTAVGVAYGGTGKTSWTKNGLVYASDTTTLAQIGVPSGASTTYWLKAVTNASGVPTYSFSTIGKSDVGLGNVDNTADANKSVNYATSAGSAGSATNATNLSRTNTSLNSSAAGWYKLAKIKTTDARGCVRLGLVTTGGSYVPYYAELMVENGWGIITFNLFGRFDYITQFRYTTDDTYSYIEGYFYNALTVYLYKLDGVGYVNDVTTGWELYSGTAVAGSGTVNGSECAQLTSNGIYTSNFMCSAGFKRVNSDDTYVLLGGGNHKALSQFVLNSSQHEAGVVSQDATTYSLSNATWTDTINLPTDVGSYILYLRTGNSTLTGIFSVGTSDNAKDEISLHLHGNGTRLYARTNNTKLQLSSNYVPTNSNPTQNTSVVIKYKRII